MYQASTAFASSKVRERQRGMQIEMHVVETKSPQSECRWLTERNKNIQNTSIYCCIIVHTKKEKKYEASNNFSSREYPLWFVTLFTKWYLE